MLARAVGRMRKHHGRRSLLVEESGADPGAEGDADAESNLAASAVWGQAPPAGAQWLRGLEPLEPHALAYDKPLCAWLDGFTLHAATRAGALDQAGREALLRYVLRPPIAQERIERRSEGLVRITLKKAYADATVADDMDPLSLLCRLATSVPPPRLHTVKYAGVLAGASQRRSRIAPKPPSEAAAATQPETSKRAGGYRPWAELLARTFAVDVFACRRWQGRMKLLAMGTDSASIARDLAAVGEATEVPRRSPSRGPPYWKSRVLRRQACGDEEGAGATAAWQTRRRSSGGARARGGRGVERSARCAGAARRSVPPSRSRDVPGRYRGGETPRGTRPRRPRGRVLTGESGLFNLRSRSSENLRALDPAAREP